MRRFVATLLLLLVFSSSSFSQVVIKKENRVLNKSPGFCAWCCLETLGRHHKIEPLYDLQDNREKEFTWEWDARNKKWIKSPYLWTDYGNYKLKEHRSPGTHRALINKLDSLNVKYRYQNYYNYNKTIIKEAVKNKQGCLVVVKCWGDNPGHDTHAVVLVDYNDDGIEFFDPNDTECTYTASHQWFNHYWLGYVLVVEGVKQ